MRQKYVFEKSSDQEMLEIKEYSELDKGLFFLTCEENYDLVKIASAIENGVDSLVALIRTENFFPSTVFARKIVEVLVAMQADGFDTKTEMMLNDLELIQKSEADKEKESKEDSKEDAGHIELDDLLEEDDAIEGDEIKILSSGNVAPLRVADDDISIDSEG